MFFESDCKVRINNCLIRRCNTTQGEGNIGGDGAPTGIANTICGSGGNAGDSGTESFFGTAHYGPRCEVYILDTIMVDNVANTVLGQNVWAGGDGSPPGDDGATGYNIGSGFVGGNYYNVNCKVELTNCTITGSQVVTGAYGSVFGGGGSEHYEQLCTTVLNNCTFIDSIGYNGGAQYFDFSCSVTANDCRYGNNLALQNGGAVFFQQYCTFDVNSCGFWMNSALAGSGLK